MRFGISFQHGPGQPQRVAKSSVKNFVLHPEGSDANMLLVSSSQKTRCHCIGLKLPQLDAIPSHQPCWLPGMNKSPFLPSFPSFLPSQMIGCRALLATPPPWDPHVTCRTRLNALKMEWRIRAASIDPCMCGCNVLHHARAW